MTCSKSRALAGILAAVFSLAPALADAARSGQHPIALQLHRDLDSPLASVHLSFERSELEGQGDGEGDGHLSYTYGPCEAESPHTAWQSIAESAVSSRHDRLVWRVPDGVRTGGCLSAWHRSSYDADAQDAALVGRSSPVSIPSKRRLRRRSLEAALSKRANANSVPMDSSRGIDAGGPWFDGVAALESNNISAVDVEAAKGKRIAVVGAGMAGLMVWLSLNMVGMRDVQLVEGSNRLGGRVHTAYFGDPSERQYQEMGPMRFPFALRDPVTNQTLDIQDHRLVFDLADEVNRLNGNASSSRVSFIPWIQSSRAGRRHNTGYSLPNGMTPTVADVAVNASLVPPPPPEDPEVDELEARVEAALGDANFTRRVATNLFAAHREWLDNGLNGLGGDSWSEFSYVHNYLRASLNATDRVLDRLGVGAGDSPFWDSIYEGIYFSPTTTWRTIDGGLNRLPNAFIPLVSNSTTFNRKITSLTTSPTNSSVLLGWRSAAPGFTQNYEAFDYAITTVPLRIMRAWTLPDFSSTLRSAIDNYPYVETCKVALRFASRWWERRLNPPIFGSCSTSTSIPGIGSVCYPSYDINSTGPGVLLASYAPSSLGRYFTAMPEAEHVAYVLDAMVQIHGDFVRDEYTGEYNRKCWGDDEFETVAWASAGVGDRQLFLPAFFQTQRGVIVAGEATSYTSAWIASALESGVRASVQILLELGLVDEAKTVAERWMARWISI